METILYIGTVIATTLANVFLARGRRPMIPNPSFADIEARHHAEEAQRKAEQALREATALVERIQREAEAERKQARARQEEADRAATRAAEEVRRMMVQMEAVSRAARLAQELAEDTAKATKQEAREEKERARRMQEDIERAAMAAREDAERAQRAAANERIKAEGGKALAAEAARTAMEERRKALKEKEEAERRLKKGIQPIITPSPEELAIVKEHVEYKEGYFHFAVAGVSGSGKSSLVNAFRGLRSEDTGAAAVGITETTLQVTRYPEANPDIPFVWYDVPGAGTPKCPDWQYFNDQGLYVFDCIIVLFDNRFTMTDVAILVNARRFGIPTYIVRSKADQHIQNLMLEMGYDSEADEGRERRDELYKAARSQFIEQTRETVNTNLADANLPDQRVYIVSNKTLLDFMKNKTPKKIIDEVQLLDGLYSQAHVRRGVTGSDEMVHTENMTRV